MMKKAFINALLAEIYIVFIVLVVDFVAKAFESAEVMFVPVVMLSIFVLSAAVMGYLFFSQPVQLYLEGQKKQAVSFFLFTILSFAILTIVSTIILFSGILS